jgi:uncharacterized protein (TIGR03067 family)
MRHAIRALFLSVLFLPLAGPTAAGNDALEGRWKVVKAERGGKPNPAEVGSIAHFSASELTMESPEGHKVTFALATDAAASPAHIDVTRERGDQSFTMKGIYRLEGDTLRMNLAVPFDERPTDFTTKPGEMKSLNVYERVSGS